MMWLLQGEHEAAPAGDTGDTASDISTTSSSDLSFASADSEEGADSHIKQHTGATPTGTGAAALAGSSDVGQAPPVPDVTSHPLPEIWREASLPSPADMAAAASSVLDAPAAAASTPRAAAPAAPVAGSEATGGAGSSSNVDGGAAGPAGGGRQGGVMSAILRAVGGGS
jgi:hypothetical protein